MQVTAPCQNQVLVGRIWITALCVCVCVCVCQFWLRDFFFLWFFSKSGKRFFFLMKVFTPAHPPLPLRLLRLPLLVLFLRPPLPHAPPSVHSLPLVAPVQILPSVGAEVVLHEFRQAAPVGTAWIIAGRRLVKSTVIQTIIIQILN